MPSLETVLGIASALAAWCALAVAMLSYFNARRARQIAEQSAETKRPSVSLYLQEGYLSRERDLETRLYAFLLLVSNRSDSDNSIQDLSLRVTYSDENDHFTVRVPASNPEDFSHEIQKAKILTAPFRIDAHQSNYWVVFFPS